MLKVVITIQCNVLNFRPTDGKEIAEEILQAANWWQNKVEAWYPSIEGDPALSEDDPFVHQQAALHMVQYINCIYINYMS